MNAATSLPIILFGCLALLIRLGLALNAIGLSRSKNAAAAVMRLVLDFSVAILAFWAVGAAILNYTGRAVVGFNFGMLFDARGEANSYTFFYLVLVLIATGPLSGAVAERAKFFPPCALTMLMAAIIVPVCANWAWSEQAWLHRRGFFDAAGATVIHLTGGLGAAAAAVITGPRSGKYNRDGSSNLIPGHNIPLASIGVLTMLAAWAPYVLGAAWLHGGLGPHTAPNILLAAAAGALVAILITRVRYGKPDVMLTYGGLLGALVAISAPAGAVSSFAAVAIGAIAGLLVPTATVLIDLRWKIDDPSGGIAVHVVGGIWGAIAVGIFTYTATITEKLHLLAVQLLGVVTIAALTLALSIPLLLVLRATVGLRLSEDAEFDGLDLAEHDLNAYPDFQQTMIKSYHLREA